jgi:hypothetical protein
MRTRRYLLLVAVNLGGAVAGLAAFILWQHVKPVAAAATRIEGSVVGLYDRVDDVGYIPRPNERATARKKAGDRLIFEAAYTIGADRFRVMPSAPGASACVLLFGDSITFGEGVNDDEPFAARIVEASRGRVAAHNFGMPGWGPHQFLAGVQSGRFQPACRPTHALYLMIPSHIHRTIHADNAWDTHGPRFRLGRDRRPVRDGNFDDPAGFGWRRLLKLNAESDAAAVALTVAVIAEAMGGLRSRYPAIAVAVVHWHIGSVDEDLARTADRQLAARGLPPHPIEAVIPGYRASPQDYHFDLAVDRHPNARGHRAIADYILREIVR